LHCDSVPYYHGPPASDESRPPAESFSKENQPWRRSWRTSEPGKRHYEYWRSAEPGLYYCLLAFDDFHSFLVHQTSDHHEKASPELGRLIAKMRLEWVDPVQGASSLPPTEMQALPTDADALTARYHNLFAAQLQDWWQPLRSH
jgi:quinol monooxygenase YgiN